MGPTKHTKTWHGLTDIQLVADFAHVLLIKLPSLLAYDIESGWENCELVNMLTVVLVRGEGMRK